MQTHQAERPRPTPGGAVARKRFGFTLTAMLVLAGALGCGPVEDTGSAPDAELEARTEELSSLNGMSVNGMSVNGMSVNGLSLHGLSLEGLSSPEFSEWFEAHPALSDMVMGYVVRCAVPAGEVRSYTDPGKRKTYTWAGWLGLAPDWASGRQATVAEQQVVSACLAAHANKYGVHIAISVLGRTAQGQAIPYTAWELSTYSKREACFFGNLFTQEGIFVGNDQGLLTGSESSLRACALSPGPLQMENACPPLTPVGNCSLYCTLDASLTYYTSCSYNGVTYRPLTTRMRPSDIYRCGDGVCQRTESCGVGVNYNSCSLDCGLCP